MNTTSKLIVFMLVILTSLSCNTQEKPKSTTAYQYCGCEPSNGPRPFFYAQKLASATVVQPLLGKRQTGSLKGETNHGEITEATRLWHDETDRRFL